MAAAAVAAKPGLKTRTLPRSGWIGWVRLSLCSGAQGGALDLDLNFRSSRSWTLPTVVASPLLSNQQQPNPSPPTAMPSEMSEVMERCGDRLPLDVYPPENIVDGCVVPAKNADASCVLPQDEYYDEPAELWKQ